MGVACRVRRRLGLAKEVASLGALGDGLWVAGLVASGWALGAGEEEVGGWPIGEGKEAGIGKLIAMGWCKFL